MQHSSCLLYNWKNKVAVCVGNKIKGQDILLYWPRTCLESNWPKFQVKISQYQGYNNCGWGTRQGSWWGPEVGVEGEGISVGQGTNVWDEVGERGEGGILPGQPHLVGAILCQQVVHDRSLALILFAW